jgi:hypothetical protein
MDEFYGPAAVNPNRSQIGRVGSLKPVAETADDLAMTDDRKPSYDFFLSAAPATSSPSPAPSSYAEEPSQHPGTVPFSGGSPVSSPYARPVPVQPGGWSQSAYAAGPTGPQRGGLPLWVAALIAIGMAVVILGILFAIAIPVFLNQRAKAQWQATKVVIPPSVAGLDRITDGSADSLIKGMVGPTVTARDIGVYGTLGPKVVVVVALKSPKAMTEAAQARERAGFLQSAQSARIPFTMPQQQDAGSLGGWFGCTSTPTAAQPGAASSAVTVCLATDQGSLFAAVIGPGVSDPADVARQARKATVTRSCTCPTP